MAHDWRFAPHRRGCALPQKKNEIKQGTEKNLVRLACSSALCRRHFLFHRIASSGNPLRGTHSRFGRLDDRRDPCVQETFSPTDRFLLIYIKLSCRSSEGGRLLRIQYSWKE